MCYELPGIATFVKIDSRHENKVFSTAKINPVDNHQILSAGDIQKPQLGHYDLS